MEGIAELRDRADAIRSTRRERGEETPETSFSGRNDRSSGQRFANDVKLTLGGFNRGVREDARVLCDEYGIAYQSYVSQDTTHVVLPFARGDMPLLNLQAVLERVLPPRAREARVSVVTIEFLFDMVDVIRKFDEVLRRRAEAYAVEGFGARPVAQGSRRRIEGGGDDTPRSASVLEPSMAFEDAGTFVCPTQEVVGGVTGLTEQYSVGSLKVFGNDFYGAPSLGDSFTQVEEIDDTDEDERIGGVEVGPDRLGTGIIDNDENAEANVQTPCTTPGNDQDFDIDLKNFAAITSVTPLDLGQDFYDVTDGSSADDASDEGDEGEEGEGGDKGQVSQDSQDSLEEEVTLEMRAMALNDDDQEKRSTPRMRSALDAEDILPGNLLLRAPRNGRVRHRHTIPSGRQMVSYTESMTLRPKGREMIEIDLKSTKNVAMQCGEMIIKPLFFYQLRGETWRVEYRRFFSTKDIPATNLGPPGEVNPSELFISTAVEGASLESLADVRKVFVDKLSGAAGRRPVLQMETTGSGEPAWFYRYAYDVETGHVLCKI